MKSLSRAFSPSLESKPLAAFNCGLRKRATWTIRLALDSFRQIDYTVYSRIIKIISNMCQPTMPQRLRAADIRQIHRHVVRGSHNLMLSLGL